MEKHRRECPKSLAQCLKDRQGCRPNWRLYDALVAAIQVYLGGRPAAPYTQVLNVALVTVDRVSQDLEKEIAWVMAHEMGKNDGIPTFTPDSPTKAQYEEFMDNVLQMKKERDAPRTGC